MTATNASVREISKPKTIDKKHPLSKSDPELKRILYQLSSQIQSAYVRASFILVSSIVDRSPTFESISYACQIVAVTIYYVKLRVTQNGWFGKNCNRDDGKEHCHIKILYQPWTKHDRVDWYFCQKNQK
ncbi:hypothetical protein BGZ47_010162 [Haplosporangium gracile]|nr:hypothetical protein BGZ47_010162 [Haplosporangium gracile]